MIHIMKSDVFTVNDVKTSLFAL